MKIWSFFPDETPDVRSYYKPYVPKRERLNDSWLAPEHARLATDMKRDWPRDDWGRPIRDGRGKLLVLDPRPTIMVSPRPVYQAL